MNDRREAGCCQKNRRGQLEVMGLAIIVVLVALGVLFVVRFVITAPSTSAISVYRDSQLASNMLSALSKTTTDCHGATVETLLQDCASAQSLECPGSRDSCAYAEKVVQDIFSVSLDVWRRTYQLRTEGNSRAALDIGQPCPGELESATRPIRLVGGGSTLILTLDICR